MGYTTYEFYTTTYHGDSITESSVFEKWNDRAADELDFLTFDRLIGAITVSEGSITSALDDPTTIKVQKSACALIDALYALDKVSQTANTPSDPNVKSKSSGGESVSYGVTETALTNALKSENERKEYLYKLVSPYLRGTGLMYAGVVE